MENKICVYSCITGDYDNIHEIEQKEPGIDYFLFTNNKKIKSNTWNVIYIEDDNLDDQRLSRKIKMLGAPIINENYDISLWMDASILFQTSIKEFIKKYHNSKMAPFSSFIHHSRNCIYEEANACIRYRKDTKENISKHMEFLKKENYPKNNGLYEMTVFIKEHNNPIVKKTMEMWFDMVCNYSKRDQLSFMYCVWKTGMKINPINLNVWNNDYFTSVKHNFKKEIIDYRIYFGDENNYNLKYDIQGEYKRINDKYIIDIKIPITTNKIKLEVSKVPCIKYKNLYIKDVNKNDIRVINDIYYNKSSIFYNDLSILEITGDFKKNNSFYLEIELRKMELNEIYGFIDYLGYNLKKEDDGNSNLRDQINELSKKNSKLEADLNMIINSKGWKILEKIRKIRNFRKKTTPYKNQ